MEQTTTSTSSTNTSPLRQLSNQMADAVERISASLVLVHGRERQPASGAVFAENLVLTASHVLEREDNLTVQTHDKRTLAAQLVGRDPATDVAVLRVDNLGVVAATASSEKVRVGQLTIAVGRSANDGPMASSGVISIVGGPLRTPQGVSLERFIRTDAIPYPGFSGGPLIDTQGDVLGILTTSLVKGDENSPAQKGGLLVGDILVALDGHAISDAEDLQVLLVGERVDKTIPVEVIRGNTLQTLSVTIGQRK